MRIKRLNVFLIVLAAVFVGEGLALGDGDRDRRRRAPRTRKASHVLLPEAGTYPARHFFPLVEKVSNSPVKPTSDKVSEKPVTISLELAGQAATLDELTLLLAAHSVFLHRHVVKKRTVLVASGSRFWKPRKTPMHTRVFTVSPRRYTTAVREVEKLLEKINHGNNKGLPDTVLLPVEATGRLLVRSASTKTLDDVGRLLEVVESEAEAGAASKTRLFAFRPTNFPGKLLKKRLRGFLDESECRQLHVVIPRGPNAMWIRTTPPLWTKVRRILTLADTPDVEWPGEPPIKKLEDAEPVPEPR
jgi:hypothetical protein